MLVQPGTHGVLANSLRCSLAGMSRRGAAPDAQHGARCTVLCCSLAAAAQLPGGSEQHGRHLHIPGVAARWHLHGLQHSLFPSICMFAPSGAVDAPAGICQFLSDVCVYSKGRLQWAVQEPSHAALPPDCHGQVAPEPFGKLEAQHLRAADISLHDDAGPSK